MCGRFTNETPGKKQSNAQSKGIRPGLNETVGEPADHNERHQAKRAAIEMAKADFSNLDHAKVYLEEGLLGGIRLVNDTSADNGR